MRVLLEDVRNVDFSGYDVIAGAIPYYLSSYLVFKALEAKKPALFVVQKEFGKRMVGKPGSSDWSRLSLMSQSLADVTYLFDISRYSFHPAPEVDSAAVLLVPKKKPLALDEKLVTALFSHKNQSVRKAFVHSCAVLGLTKDAAKKRPLPFEQRRVRTLSAAQWVALSQSFKKTG